MVLAAEVFLILGVSQRSTVEEEEKESRRMRSRGVEEEEEEEEEEEDRGGWRSRLYGREGLMAEIAWSLA